MKKTVHFELQEQVSKVVTPDKGEVVKASAQGKRTDRPLIIHPRVKVAKTELEYRTGDKTPRRRNTQRTSSTNTSTPGGAGTCDGPNARRSTSQGTRARASIGPARMVETRDPKGSQGEAQEGI